MKKFWMVLGLLLVLTGCEEANEIFGYDEYGYSDVSDNIQIGEECYPGPIYVDATSWGSIAYVNDKYVNKGIKMLISEVENAEGGREIDVTSNLIAINDLSAGMRYYYCLCMPEGGIKSEIMSFVVPDVSTLGLKINRLVDSFRCTIQDSINPVFIIEKGFSFKFNYEDDVYKYAIEGDEFVVSLSDIIKKFSILHKYFSVYAYVQTPNACHRSATLYLNSNSYNVGINQNDISLSGVFEEVIDSVDYIGCTVSGSVDSVYFYTGGNDAPNKRIYPDKIEGTTFYVKKGIYRNIRLKAFYKLDDGSDSYELREKETDSYTPTQKIRSLNEFLEFVRIEDASSSDDVVHVSLLTDITLPSDMRLSINLSGIILDGNGHTLDGVSYFPLFHNLWQTDLKQAKVRNLKIGTDETIYIVKEGTSSLSTTDNETPRYFLSNDNASLPIYTDSSGYPSITEGNNSKSITFSNCEVRGTFKVYGRSSFYFYYMGLLYNDYCTEISGLENFAKFEYVTTEND